MDEPSHPKPALHAPGARLSAEEFSLRLQNIRPRIVVALEARLGRRLRRFVDAEDLWQETSMEAMKSEKDFQWQGEGAFVRFIMTLATRCLTGAARHHLGREGDRPETIEIEDLASAVVRSTTGPATRAQREEEVTRVLETVRTLHPTEREVLTLDLVHLMTHREMAEHLGRTLDAVRKAHFRALRSIRSVLGGRG